ncbi:hypothetical protein D3C75_1100200 [compost metagenome]
MLQQDSRFAPDTHEAGVHFEIQDPLMYLLNGTPTQVHIQVISKQTRYFHGTVPVAQHHERQFSNEAYSCRNQS